MASADLIMLTAASSPAAEAYRTLRTNLMFSSADRPITAFVVASAANADDKSATAANLAVAFAQAGHRTVLVDADMRRPQQHTLWGVDGARGLATMMVDDSALSSPPLIATSVDKLHLLPAGAQPGNPADLLSSQRMGDILGLLKARANYVIFEAPPVLAVSDAALLGAKTDGVLLVVRSGKTRRDQTVKAREALERVHVRVLGAVLTGARRESRGGY
jgi:capsular exopolysaccharide synthesis family protein